MINCKICGKEFEKMIPWRHLKNDHQIDTKEYKNRFGAVISAELKNTFTQSRAGERNPNFGKRHAWTTEQKNKLKGRIPHNKGKKIEGEALNKIQQSILAREEKYANGDLQRFTPVFDEQRKQKISQGVKKYSELNPEKCKQRARKSIQTLKNKNYDFGSKMRGKQHSEETKLKIKNSLHEHIQQSKQQTHERLLKNILDNNLILVDDTSADQTYLLKLQCVQCSSIFTYTKQIFYPSKYKGEICPTCYPRPQPKKSKAELEIFEFISTYFPDAISGYKHDNKYHGREIDIFIPSKNVGIEFNGLYWHSEDVLLSLNQSPKKDYEKRQFFLNHGIRLINIFEDEWTLKKEIVKDRLAHILNIPDTKIKIFARKCVVTEIDSKTANLFCQENHIMGRGRSNIRLGLFFEKNLVSVMTFSSNNISRKLSDGCELNRFCSKIGYSIVGGAGKLLTYFQKKYNPDKIISYADNRWSAGDLYQTLKFTKTNDGVPNYWYFLPNDLIRIHRFSLRKQSTDDQSLTEAENRKNQGFLRIWDCGSSKWELKKGA